MCCAVFGGGSASYQRNVRNVIASSAGEHLGGLCKSDNPAAAIAKVQPALEMQAVEDPLTMLVLSLTDVGDLRELVKGTLDVETVDLVRKRNHGPNLENTRVEETVPAGTGVSPGKNLVEVPVTHSLQGGRARLCKPKVMKRG